MRATSSLVEPVDFNSSKCRALSSSCLRSSVTAVAVLSVSLRLVVSWVWREVNSFCNPATSSFFLVASCVKLRDGSLGGRVSFCVSAPFSVWRVVDLSASASLVVASTLARAVVAFLGEFCRCWDSLSVASFAVMSSRSLAAAAASVLGGLASDFLQRRRSGLRQFLAAFRRDPGFLACKSFRRAVELVDLRLEIVAVSLGVLEAFLREL